MWHKREKDWTRMKQVYSGRKNNMRGFSIKDWYCVCMSVFKRKVISLILPAEKKTPCMSAGMLVGQPDAFGGGGWLNERININNNNHCKQEQKQQWPRCWETHNGGPWRSTGSIQENGYDSLVDHNDRRWPLARYEVNNIGSRPRCTTEVYTAWLCQAGA